MKKIALLIVMFAFWGYFAQISEARVLFPRNMQKFVLDQKNAIEEEKFEKRFRTDLEKGNREPETISSSLPGRILEEKLEGEEVFPLQLEFFFGNKFHIFIRSRN